MKIKIIKPCEVEVFVGSDVEGEPIFETETFNVGEVFEVDVGGFACSFDGKDFRSRKDFPMFEFCGGFEGMFSAETFEVIEGAGEFEDAWAEFKE